MPVGRYSPMNPANPQTQANQAQFGNYGAVMTSIQGQQGMAKAAADALGQVYVPGTRMSGNTGFTGGMSGGGISGGGVAGGGGAIVKSKGAGGGSLDLSRDAYERQQEMLLKQKMADSAFAKLSGSGGGDAGPSVNYGGADSEAARAGAFARAKENAGANAAAAMKSMEDIVGRKGLRGSTIEGGMIGDAIQGGANTIAQHNTAAMGEELDHLQHVDDTVYQGGITQRGQNASAKQALMSILASVY